MDLSQKRIPIADLPHDAIVSFEGEYRFLSNFAPSSLTVYGISFPTVEHAFAAIKIDPQENVHNPSVAIDEMHYIADKPVP